MPGVSAKISVLDAATPAIEHMYRGVGQLISGMYKLNEASGNAIDMSPFLEAQKSMAEAVAVQKQLANGCSQVGEEYKRIKEYTEQANDAQRQYNSNLSSGINSAAAFGDKLTSGIKKYITMAASAYGGKQLIDASDTWINNSARLGLITDSLEKQNVLQQRIYKSAKDARGAYGDTVDVVARLGLLAGDAFGSNEEIVKFTELMNKSFKISGASTQEKTAAMYQLTQAMASGRLQGDEFRSIIENAPMLANAIAEYTGVGREGLKDLSSDGEISGDIIKNALFSAADDIESKFSTLPMTFGDAWTNVMSDTTMAFSDVYNQMNDMLNSDFGQSVVSGLSNNMAWLSEQIQEALKWIQDLAIQGAPGLAELGDTIRSVASEFTGANGVINVVGRNIVSIFGSEGARTSIRIYATAIGSVAKGLSGVLNVITPLLPYVTSTYIMFKSYQTLTGIFNPIATAIQGISSSFITVTTSVQGATVAQSTFNAVCNTNVLFAIASAVLGIASAWSQVASQEKYAAECAVANNNINTALQSGIDNVTASDYAAVNGVDLNTAKSILATQKDYQEQIKAINDEQESKRYQTGTGYGQYYKALSQEQMNAIVKIEKANPSDSFVNKFKSNSSEYGTAYAIGETTYDIGKGIVDFIKNPIESAGDLIKGYDNPGAKLTFDMSKIKDSDYNNSLAETAKRTAELEKQMSDQIQAYKDGYKETQDMLKEMEKIKAGDGSLDVGDVDNVNHINDTVDIASEDLRYMRELAEQEAINQFTSKLLQPQINVTFGEVKETADVDAIVKRITEGLEESLNNSGDIVHI
ncbi:MAG: tape measure protein [Clostridia bacterium]|nr:tape measure protein [Clostridia bacterium]